MTGTESLSRLTPHTPHPTRHTSQRVIGEFLDSGCGNRNTFIDTGGTAAGFGNCASSPIAWVTNQLARVYCTCMISQFGPHGGGLGYTVCLSVCLSVCRSVGSTYRNTRRLQLRGCHDRVKVTIRAMPALQYPSAHGQPDSMSLGTAPAYTAEPHLHRRCFKEEVFVA